MKASTARPEEFNTLDAFQFPLPLEVSDGRSKILRRPARCGGAS